MRHPTSTRIIFADSPAEAEQQYRALKIETKDPAPVLECYKVLGLSDFDVSEDLNFVGEISVGPPVMKLIRQNPPKAYVLYYMEDVKQNN